ADPAILGRRVRVDGEPVTVIGILSSDFRFPAWNTVIWRPIDFDAPPPARVNDLAVAYVRFAASLPRSESLRLATDAARHADPATAQLRAWARPLAGMELNDYGRRAVPLLAAGVVLVFLVLCANVASLLLARLTSRQREFSMCSALGASRGRLMRQAFAESVIIGCSGAVAGITLASALVALARAFLPEAFLVRSLNPLNLDLRAVIVTAAAGVTATLAAGLWPAWIGTRADAGAALRVVDRGGTESRGARALTRALLVAEMALACTLLVGAALLVRSFVNLARAERGLDVAGLIAATISLPRTSFPDAPARMSVAEQMEAAVRGLPGVERVARSYGLPPAGGGLAFGEWQADVPGSRPVNMEVESYSVGPEFFSLYGIPLLRGRTFGRADPDNQVVVGERFARALWGDADPLGGTFSRGRERFTVVGLVREIHHPSLDARLDRPEFYQPFGGVGNYAMMSIRCAQSCPDVARLRRQLTASHPAVQVVEVRPLEDVYFEQLARPRATAALAFAFAAIAILAAAGGLFSVLTFAVGQRRREFGIRTALGASPVQIRRLVIRDGLLVAVAGVALGSAAAWGVGRALSSMQYGVTMSDPLSWLVVLVVLGATTAAASWRPAREASRVDPVLLLRSD
ncbi:MAG TPA: FtsX-like permease family protein, partial [Vicinamibacterales bacterium]|nr:FtsX-like permease family protein [Vicinamibacterales bacterium]